MSKPGCVFDLAVVTVTLHPSWLVATLLLLLPYLLWAAWWGSEQLGSGPQYTRRENFGGTVAVLSGAAAPMCAGYAIYVLAVGP